MSEIKHVAVIGLGAVGINFASIFRAHMKKEHVWIVADPKRVQRYQQDGVYYNDERCDFHYVDPAEMSEPADLVLFTTKFMGLKEAMVTVSPLIGKDTILMSAVNGISSEEVLAQMFAQEQIIYSVAQGMDATKVGNHVQCSQYGELCFGDAFDGKQTEIIQTVARFFDSVNFPYTIKADILHHQWGKFMLNVGLNQVVAIHRGTYATIQKEGWERTEMLLAMREVKTLSEYENVDLTEEEVLEWASLCDQLSPQGKPSMAQDVDARRKTEVELFALEVLKRARKFGLRCPVNEYLARSIQTIEASYEKFDDYSYQCGVMDAFAEMVGAGVKKLGLSHPFSSKQEMEQYLPYANLLCERYQIHCFEEDSLLISDLFPTSCNKGKYNLIFYQDSKHLNAYLQLKEMKRNLLAQHQYVGEKRKQLAMAFGALLSYDKASCEVKMKGNDEKEA